ncbi:MAG: hypothetical protein ACP5M4_16165, partial [Acidobacteriaceae bacterium]
MFEQESWPLLAAVSMAGGVHSTGSDFFQRNARYATVSKPMARTICPMQTHGPLRLDRAFPFIDE